MPCAGNTAAGTAAVINVTSSDVRVVGSLMSGNRVDQHGGALAQNMGSLSIIDSRCQGRADSCSCKDASIMLSNDHSCA